MKIEIKLNSGQTDSMEYLIGDHDENRAIEDAIKMASSILHKTELSDDVETLSIQTDDGKLIENGKVIGTYELFL